MTETAKVVVPIKRDEDNPFKIVHQFRKARKIANAWLEYGGTYETIKDADNLYVVLIANVAGVEVPNGGRDGVVWAIAKEMVREASEE